MHPTPYAPLYASFRRPSCTSLHEVPMNIRVYAASASYLLIDGHMSPSMSR